MRNATIPIVLAGLLLLAACEPVVSVHPLYTEADLVTDARLLGCWTEKPEEPDESLFSFTITDNGDKSYSLFVAEEDGTQSQFRAYLTKLGDHLFLDIQPVPVEGPDFIYRFHMATLHTFYLVRFKENSLRLAIVENPWVDHALAEGRVELPHRRSSDPEKREHSVVLTAPTKQLQQFVLKYADDEDAFTEFGTYYVDSQCAWYKISVRS